MPSGQNCFAPHPLLHLWVSIIFILLSAIAGIASGKFLTLLRKGLDWVAKSGGILTFLFGVHMTGLFSFRALLGEKRGPVHKNPAYFRQLGLLKYVPLSA